MTATSPSSKASRRSQAKKTTVVGTVWNNNDRCQTQSW